MEARLQGFDTQKFIGRIEDIDPYERQLTFAPLLKKLGYTVGDWIWLARGIISESNRPEEMYLVGWIMRRRTEAGYYGATSYKETILAPFQFSAFRDTSLLTANERRLKRLYTRLQLADSHLHNSWDDALQAALDVLMAPPYFDPFAGTETLHYFSPVSMRKDSTGRPTTPHWLSAGVVTKVVPGRYYDRFRFVQVD